MTSKIFKSTHITNLYTGKCVSSIFQFGHPYEIFLNYVKNFLETYPMGDTVISYFILHSVCISRRLDLPVKGCQSPGAVCQYQK